MNLKEKEPFFTIGGLPLFFIIIVVIILAWFLLYNFWILPKFGHNDFSKAGQYGDAFGAINSVFSALAFAGLFYTILMQRKELKETRDEFKIQNETLSMQRFENTFFNLLTIFLTSADSLKSSAYQNRGRLYLDEFVGTWNSTLHQNNLTIYIDGSLALAQYKDEFRMYIQSQIPSMSHYLQSLAGLFSFITTSSLLQEKQRDTYYQILKNSLSQSERKFLFYFIILGNSPDKTHADLVELEKKLMVIGSITEEELIHSSHLTLMKYAPTAIT